MMSVYKSLQSYLGLPEDRRSNAEPKGIGSILDMSVAEKQRRSSQSLRRTLSADMSSKGWVARENPLRKTCSSYELFCNSGDESDSDDEHQEQSGYAEEQNVFSFMDEEITDNQTASESEEEHDMWNLIRPRDKPDAFSSLVALTGVKKTTESESKWEPCKPYVYPNTKRKSLSDKSLQLCTEGLGCESGTDCSSQSFSDFGSDKDYNYSSASDDNVSVSEDENHQSPSEDDATEDCNVSSDEDEDCESEESCNSEENCIQKVNYGARHQRGLTRSFPPPLPSISRSNGPCVYMRSYKKDGRFLLQAVTVASQKYLQAHREGGRLQLQFIPTKASSPQPEQNADFKKFSKLEDVEDEKAVQEFKEDCNRLEQSSSKVTPENYFTLDVAACSSPALKKSKDNALERQLNLSNLRQHIAKSEQRENFSKKDSYLNLNLKFERWNDNDASLFKGLREPEISCSTPKTGAEDEFLQLKLRRDIERKSRENDVRLNGFDKSYHVTDSGCNSFVKPTVIPAINAYNGWRNSLQSRPSQSLMASPSLLNYPLDSSRCAADVNESARSLPKFPLKKEGFARCKERKWLLIWKASCVATS